MRYFILLGAITAVGTFVTIGSGASEVTPKQASEVHGASLWYCGYENLVDTYDERCTKNVATGEWTCGPVDEKETSGDGCDWEVDQYEQCEADCSGTTVPTFTDDCGWF